MTGVQISPAPPDYVYSKPEIPRILKFNQIRNIVPMQSGGFQAWSKEQGLGPCGVGLRGFKSHPPHLYKQIAGGITKGDSTRALATTKIVLPQ